MLWLEVRNPIFGKIFNLEIANLFGLTPEDIDQKYPIEVVSTGLPYLILPLKKNLHLSNASNSTMYK
jgi:trans-2,3-dihydro-3-hydroxyanthranilate isomerase